MLPYTSEGEEIVLKDGSKHTISLLFQYKNGLFINFWKKYDAIIRHSFNQVEANVPLPVHQLMSMDILTPVTFRGQYLLFDGLSYSLPANKIVPVDLTLRTLRLIGPYDLDKEQEIPAFGSKLFTWEFRSSNIETAKENERNRILQQARDEWNKPPTAVSEMKSITYSLDGYTTRNDDRYLVENYPQEAGITLQRNYKCKATAVISIYYSGSSIHDPGVYRDVTYESEFEYTDTFVSIVYSG